MSDRELKILRKVLDYANDYFDDYLSLTDEIIYNSEDEIDEMVDDGFAKEKAIDNMEYNDLLAKAECIINKYIDKKGVNNNG